MASIEQKYPLNYKVRGDTLDDFGYKYLMESERILEQFIMLQIMTMQSSQSCRSAEIPYHLYRIISLR